MQLKIFNTLSQQLEQFRPANPKQIKMYVCGPTVYDSPHIGNARSIVVYDILYRTLLELYGHQNVTYVRNITDVDDKINIAAKRASITIQELTTRFTRDFHEDVSALVCLSPSIEPKATEHISDIVTMIEKLLTHGNAYVSNKHVYFAVSSFPDYGKLAAKDVEHLEAGSRVEISEDKRAPEDFVLWKPQDEDDDPSSVFDSPWGKGRPGWHIECSAMSTRYLGPTFDIHGGGIDLIFPHHTNEIAQSCSCYIGSNYARYWVHNGFLTVNGQKMSKSLNNFFTVKDILKQGVAGETIRYVYLTTHYRKPLNWTQKGVEDAKKALDSFYRVLQNHTAYLDNPAELVKEALFNDLNTSDALGLMHNMAHKYHVTKNPEEKENIASTLYASGKFIGLFCTTPDNWFKLNDNADAINELVQLRIHAKKEKNWQKADEIRDKLKVMQIVLEDGPNNTTSWKKL